MIARFDETSTAPAAVISHLKHCWEHMLASGPEGPMQGYMRDALEKLEGADLNDLKGDDTQLLVALNDARQLQGTIFYLERGGNWYFWGLYVAPECQGRGIGSELLKAVEMALPPASVLRATVDQSDQRVRHFYRERGYQEVTLDSPMGRRMTEQARAEGAVPEAEVPEAEVALLIIEKAITA